MNFKISDKNVGADRPCFIIAEMSANHNQSYDLAVKTVEAAHEAGADAIKFQTYTPDTITIDSDQEYFKINHGTIWDGKTLYELYEEAYMPWEWQPKLKETAESLGLVCFSSPFDHTAVDFLEKMNVPAYKIASPEITDIPLIKYVASKGKPILISTGIATLNDISQAVKACREVNNNQIALLKCTSFYPAPIEEANLNTLPDIVERFDTVVGISDHTLGIVIPVTAIALGAKIIEKHFILDKSIVSPDSEFSLDKSEFKNMVKAVRIAEDSLGSINYDLSVDIKKVRQNSRSLFVVEDIKVGNKFTNKNIKSIRPGQGMPPVFIDKLIGKKAKKNYKKGTPVLEDMIPCTDY